MYYMFTNAKNWKELMNEVKISRIKNNNIKNNNIKNNIKTSKLNMDICLLEIENKKYDKIIEKEITTFDTEIKLELLKMWLKEWKKKYATEIQGVDYDPLIIMGELIIELYNY